MSAKDIDMGKPVQIRANELVKIAVTLYGGEVQKETGKKPSWSDALYYLLEETRPDLIATAERLLKEQSA